MGYPSLVLKNQFGEESNNFILGGSSQINCNFIVDHSNGNGLGIRSLKGQGVKNVYMNTSATPASGNPNPLAGFAIIQLESNYAGYQGGSAGFVSPVSGTPINISSGLSVGQAYVITSLGSSTPANWQALGFPSNQTPQVGAFFIATSASAGTGTGVVEIPATAGSKIQDVETFGNPQLMLNPSDNSGAIIMVQFLAATSSSVTTLIPTAPADGSVVNLTFSMINVPESLI